MIKLVNTRLGSGVVRKVSIPENRASKISSVSQVSEISGVSAISGKDACQKEGKKVDTKIPILGEETGNLQDTALTGITIRV